MIRGLTQGTWVRYPPLDDHEFGYRGYMQGTSLAFVDVNNKDFVHFYPDGKFVRRNGRGLQRGMWTVRDTVLSFYADDVLIETWGFKVDGDRLFRG